MSQYRELLLGCGHKRDKRIDPRNRERPFGGNAFQWGGVVETLDYERECRPDIVFDLNKDDWRQFAPDTYDEVHAYEVLEHLGRQGDWRAFFEHFQHIWRILKPGGFLCATVPSESSQWLWGDPGHTRVILPCTLIFLNQPQYEIQKGNTSMSDYRSVYRGDFDIVKRLDDGTTHRFILQAVKPARIGQL